MSKRHYWIPFNSFISKVNRKRKGEVKKPGRDRVRDMALCLVELTELVTAFDDGHDTAPAISRQARAMAAMSYCLLRDLR